MDNQLPKSFMILLAVLQGIALTLLYRSLEGATWPASDPIWFTSLATFVISFPLLTLLAVEQGNIKKLLIYFKQLFLFVFFNMMNGVSITNCLSQINRCYKRTIHYIF